MLTDDEKKTFSLIAENAFNVPYVPVYLKKTSATLADVFCIRTDSFSIHISILSVSLNIGIFSYRKYKLFIQPFDSTFRASKSFGPMQNYFFRQYNDSLFEHSDFWLYFKQKYATFFLSDCTRHEANCLDKTLQRVPTVDYCRHNLICSTCMADVNIYWKQHINYDTLSLTCERKNETLWKIWEALGMDEYKYTSYIQFFPEEVLEAILSLSSNFHE